MNKRYIMGYIFSALFVFDIVCFFIAFFDNLKLIMVLCIIGAFCSLQTMRALKILQINPMDILKKYEIKTVEEHMKDVK